MTRHEALQELMRIFPGRTITVCEREQYWVLNDKSSGTEICLWAQVHEWVERPNDRFPRTGLGEFEGESWEEVVAKAREARR